MNPDFGTNAQSYRLKRVLYEGTKTLRVGMPVCYNHDTTSNILGWDKGNSVRGTTTAEGYQNEGKFKRVEDPSIANSRFFAGILVDAKNINQTASGSEWIDIAIPNGAIIPVYTDKSVSIGDPAYLEAGQQTVIANGTTGCPQIGWFMETVDRSSTAGLALAQIVLPEMSSYASASTLGVGLSPLLWGDAPTDCELGDPGNGINFFDDFMNQVDVTTGDGWVLTQVDTKGSITVEAVAAGGVMQFTSATGDSADDGISAQLKNCAVKPAAGVNIWFEARVKVSDATQQWFLGLMAVDTTPIASGVIDDASDKVGFFHHAASTDNKVSSITARTSADDATADVAACVDDTWMTIGFKVTGLTKVEFYVNGVLVETGSTAANIPNAGLCLTAASYYESADNILSVDWVKIKTDAGRDA